MLKIVHASRVKDRACEPCSRSCMPAMFQRCVCRTHMSQNLTHKMMISVMMCPSNSTSHQQPSATCPLFSTISISNISTNISMWICGWHVCRNVRNLCSPNEDFGRIDKRWNPDFRYTFQWVVAQIEYSHPWKVHRKSWFHLLSVLPKSSFGMDKWRLSKKRD